MGVSQILDTGKQALLAQQRAIHVAGQNIANVNTPGYSRERPHFVPQETSLSGVFQFGVSVDQVTRVFDQFITHQVNVATTNFASDQTQADLLQHVESLFNDLNLEDAGLAAALGQLFDAFENLATNPQGLPERNLTLTRANTVVDLFHNLHIDLETIRSNINGQMVPDELNQVNVLTSQIANINRQIQQVETDPQNNANTLRDERDQLIKQLAEKVPITSFETNDGSVTVLLGGGRPLVEGVFVNTLVAVSDPNDPASVTIKMQNSKGTLSDISASITGGKLHGLLEFRDTSLARFTNNLNRLAAQLSSAVNQSHTTGYGLDGTTGNLFFIPRQVTGQALSDNTGGGVLQSVSVFDPTQLTLDDYRLTFVANGPPPTFDVLNSTTGATVLAGQAYTSGASIYFDGIELVLNDSGTSPTQGDVFVLSTTKNAARTIALAPGVQNDLNKIAAAQIPQPGDNTNALALANLRFTPLIDGSTLNDFYHALVGDIGLDTQNRTLLAERNQLLLTEVENQRESLSGVSLEEEQLDLIRFQQAFEAAARLIQVANEMADIVVNLIQ